MSIDCLTYAEEFYYYADPLYRNAVKSELKERGFSLRLPGLNEAMKGITSFVIARQRQKGYYPTRVRKRWRKSNTKLYLYSYLYFSLALLFHA